MTGGSSSRSTPSAAALAVTNRWTVFGPAWPPSDRPGQSKKTTLARWCRLRSYLDSAAAHGTTALDAIRSAL
jgi:hypothetical protein